MTTGDRPSWPCPQCRARVDSIYVLTMVRFSQTIPMYCSRCDTSWTLTTEERSQLLTYLEERAQRNHGLIVTFRDSPSSSSQSGSSATRNDRNLLESEGPE